MMYFTAHVDIEKVVFVSQVYLHPRARIGTFFVICLAVPKKLEKGINFYTLTNAKALLSLNFYPLTQNLTQKDTIGFHYISPYRKLVLNQLLLQCRGHCMLFLSENIYRPSHSFPASLKIDMLLTRLPFH
jgi:hypothetical protein